MYTTWTYTPKQKHTLKLSRSRIELFMNCRRCFWLLMRQNIKRPSIPDFLLNQAVDELLKKEFDDYRSKQQAHPLIKQAKLPMIPYQTDKMDVWRDNFKGIEFLVKEYNFLIFGAVDDLWWHQAEEAVVVVDYKATAKSEAITALYKQGSYHDGYRRQAEIYQWLLQKNNFKVHPTAYFVYANGRKNKPTFDKKLQFDLTLIDYNGRTDWIEPVLEEIYQCLQGELPPVQTISENEANKQKQTKSQSAQYVCEYCNYVYRRAYLMKK